MTELEKPPQTSWWHEMLQARLTEAWAAPGGERLTVELRGVRLHLPVVTVPVDALYYNPLTHRVRAQLAYFPNRQATVDRNPWVPQAQEVLGSLLKMQPAQPELVDPAYTKLKTDLGQGQREPGIITHDGVLVNGNTRRLALLEISGPKTNMRVAVLPASADWNDVADIELDLQMADDLRREYSWVNRLVAIDERMALGTPSEVIAARFRSTKEMIEREHWIYALTRTMIDRSRHGKHVLPLIAFEDKAEHLREMARFERKLSATDARAADVAAEARIAAIMLDFSKTDVRYVDEKFFPRYLLDELPENIRAAADEAPVRIPGLGDVTVPGAPAVVVSARALATAVLQARAEGTTSAGFRQLRELMAAALERAGRDNRVRKKKAAAPDRLRDVAASLDLAGSDITMSLASRTFDPEEIDEALGAVRASLRKIAPLLGRANAQGKNVQWLIDSLAREGS